MVSTRRLAFPSVFFILVAACGGSTTIEQNGSSSSGTHGTGGSVGAGGSNPGPGAPCHVDPAGSTFTFHVHNTGTQMLSLTYGCGGTMPMVLNTPAGMLSIGPGAVNGCEFTCEMFYKGPVQQGCSDCGPGVGAILAPGSTVDIPWDRRVYEAHTADPSCVMGMTGVSCALAVSMAPTASQAGVLTVCGSVSPAALGNNAGGYCTSSTFTVNFMADTTKTEATIDVQ
jgi:hypothetical protein